MSLAIARHHFSVDDLDRMVAAGVLPEDDRIELIDGELVEMAAIGSQHAGCVKTLNRLLSVAVGGRLVVSVQDPVRLSRDSQPQPDVAVLRARDDTYRGSHPTAAEVMLLIEVADASAAFDRGAKLVLYARACVPEVWVVDLVSGRLEAYSEPSAEGYRLQRVRIRGDQVDASTVPGLSLSVTDILGWRHDLLQRFEVVPRPEAPASAEADEDDRWVLASARHGRAEVPVTGDSELVALRKFEGMPIVSPRGLWELLRSG